jgi:two-component SAPR family response regulator
MMLTCLIIDDEPLARRLIELFASKTNLSVINSFGDLTTAFSFLEEIKYEVDVIFLDVEVHEESSIILLNKTGKDKDIKIVFISAYPASLFDNYNILYFDWLQKPISYLSFEEVVARLKFDKSKT